MVKTKPRKTMTFRELKRLTYCNSPKIPRFAEFRGKIKGKTVSRFMEYVGIGWIEILPSQAQDPVLVAED